MTANKNEPGQKPSGSASAQAGNRPHATIDLKATEITPPASETEKEKIEKEKEAAKVAGASGAAKTAAATPGGAGAAPSSTSTGSAAPKAAAGDASTEGKSGKAGADAGKPSGNTPPRTAPRGYGGFFTHLAAGVAGGVVALFAADMLATQLGFEAAERPDTMAAIEQRISALETSHSQSTIPQELATRLAAAETKLGKVDQLDANIEGVTRKQADLDKAVGNMGEKLLAQGTDTQANDRIAKLEEQLKLMSSAADQDPQSGRVPQLAAITGKLADLESTLANQLDALRQKLTQEIDTRLTAATEASEAARSGTQRMDRELSVLKADSAELTNGMTALKSDADRAASSLRTTQEDLKRLKTDIDTRLAAFAKPEDVTSAVSPLSSKLAALHDDVQNVIKSEGDRRSTAERIVLSLELANLKRAIDRGKPYAPELKQAQKVAGSIVDLSPLERFSLDGVQTTTELRAEFKPVAFKIIDAEGQPADASIVDRLLSGARSVVRVRRTNHAADDKSVEAVVSRMETALDEDRLGDVLEQAKTLPPAAQDAASDFLAKVEARNAVDRALASVETQLKASLAAAPADAGNSTAQ
ncbi:MAG TPA: hypothetical protein VNR51_08010 [Hyphomicrobium sp.]|nr:hypothetical protein [Hyphomicrobium sp.]